MLFRGLGWEGMVTSMRGLSTADRNQYGRMEKASAEVVLAPVLGSVVDSRRAQSRERNSQVMRMDDSSFQRYDGRKGTEVRCEPPLFRHSGADGDDDAGLLGLVEDRMRQPRG